MDAAGFSRHTRFGQTPSPPVQLAEKKDSLY